MQGGAPNLSQKNMPHSTINILVNRMAGRNHIPVLELHGFSTLCPKLPTHNDLENTESPINTWATSTEIKTRETLVNRAGTSQPFAHDKPEYTIAMPLQIH